MTMRRTPLLVALLTLPLVLAACGQGETRDESGEITTGGDTDVFTIAVGDCFDDEGDLSGTTEVNSLPTVPCSQAHDNEVYAEYVFPDGDYPGTDAVETTATQECLAQWKTFVGLDFEASALEVYPIYPTQGSWEQADDRVVSCAIWDPAGPVTGTLEGAAY
ncbi:septum formation family protein [Litorihabitans aurantiacus]|uniref:Septum formation-related domain-containing protein n=1 Tax=Litorihabitans aurantiacus TaxID=1930061 RepID=A0AA37XD95_9MICO|nr:septum formation family protein [Litorihabitans aurantiacus]GMA30945.1 hypothetical protein GCM10025875_09370 [Litorihabitans aurantiacus]